MVDGGLVVQAGHQSKASVFDDSTINSRTWDTFKVGGSVNDVAEVGTV